MAGYNFTNRESGNPTYNPQAWGGYGRQTRTNDWNDTPIVGTSAADEDVERYRSMAAMSAPSARIDQTQSNAARGEQMYALGQTKDAMGLMRDAAYGNAPSAAEIYGGKLIDDSINAQMAVASSAVGGPTATGAAMRNAAFQGAQMQQSGARDLAAMRADEMARARDQYLGAAGSYAGQAGAMRGQDIGVATSQAGLDNAGYDRNQGRELAYEQMAWNTRKQEQDAALQHQQQSDEAWARGRQLKMQDEESAWGKVKDVVGGIAGFAGSIFSDERTKMAYMPIGGAAQMPYVPAGASPSFAGPSGMLGGSPLGELKAHSDFATRFTRNAGSGPAMLSDASTKYVVSDERSKWSSSPTSLKDSEGKYLLSDARAKREAFVDGINFGQAQLDYAQGAGPEPTPPKYMPNVRVPGGGAHGVYALQVDKPAEYDAMAANRPWQADEDPMASANRAQAGSVYTYKPGFAEASGQAPGEPNVGPMAQNMAADPLAATAVKQEPNSGMLVLDNDKLQKVQSAGIGSLQNQVDRLRQSMQQLIGRRR